MDHEYADVVVVGAGNAALCAALAAREQGASVLVLERAPYEERGGNSRYTAGAIRTRYDGLDDLLKLVPDLNEEEKRNTDFGSYTAEKFYEDMDRICQFRSDPDLTPIMVTRSLETWQWLHDNHGLRFVPAYSHQAFQVDGRFRFWGGITLLVSGGGPGLIELLTAACDKSGIPIEYGARAVRLITDEGVVQGVVVRRNHKEYAIRAGAVVMACGGFEANTEWRTRYLGPGWELAKVRGSKQNTGDGIRMAMDAGAVPWGNWSGCHAVGWDRNAPDFGDLSVGDGFQKHSYPFGIMVNARGERFVDEGADFRNYTYAEYGRRVLEQPGQFAWQVFDSKVTHLLRDEYRIREVTRVRADTLEELAEQLEDVDGEKFLETVHAYNDAVRTDVPFDPTVKDGRSADGLPVPRRNWANRLDEPPYEAYAVTCGITFTFGGVRINTEGQVLDEELEPIPGLYAAGELVGGLFYFNYPGGTGLTFGAVFGRLAGDSAGKASTA
ncbi:MAG: FAD-dependent tricarballylate dehydrogenase TcuA [Thermomicrobiales bacterium]